jgi:hypothetical protein
VAAAGWLGGEQAGWSASRECGLVGSEGSSCLLQHRTDQQTTHRSGPCSPPLSGAGGSWGRGPGAAAALPAAAPPAAARAAARRGTGRPCHRRRDMSLGAPCCRHWGPPTTRLVQASAVTASQLAPVTSCGLNTGWGAVAVTGSPGLQLTVPRHCGVSAREGGPHRNLLARHYLRCTGSSKAAHRLALQRSQQSHSHPGIATRQSRAAKAPCSAPP